MSLDGLMFRALTNEIAPRVSGGRVQRVFHPDDQSLALELYMGPSRPILVLSAHPRYPSLHLEERLPARPRQTPILMLLRKHLAGARLSSLAQHGWDRVVLIDVSGLDATGAPTSWRLALEVLGARSDVLLLNGDGAVVETLRRGRGRTAPGEVYVPPEAIKLPPDHGEFTSLFERRWADVRPDTTLDRAVFSMVDGPGPLSAREMVWRGGYLPATRVGQLEDPARAGADLAASCREVAMAVDEGKMVPCRAVVDGKMVASGFPLEHLGRVRWQESGSAADLARELFHHQRARVELDAGRSRLGSAVTRRLKRARRKLERQRGDLASAGDPGDHRRLGELLTAHLHLVSRGDSRALVPDYDREGREVEIDLDPRLSPADNAQKYFRLYRRAARAREAAERLLAATVAEIRYLEELELAVEAAETPGDVEEIEMEMTRKGLLRPPRAKTARDRTPAAAPRPLLFRAPSGRPIAVGKNNRQNEYVTFRWAAASDLWFHVKDMPGSHVVLRVEGDPPREDIEAAALLAAHYSRGRQGGNVAVDFTRVSRVKRQPRSGPGQVIYTGHETLFVTPDESLLPDRSDQDRTG